MLRAIPQTMMRASDMSNMKYISPYVFMTGNDYDLDKEQTMKTIWTTTTTKNKRRKDNEEYVDSNSTNDNEGKQYYEVDLTLCVHDRQ